MNRRKFITASAVAGGAPLLASSFPTPAISQNRRQWRMQHTWPPNAPLLASGPEIFAKFVERASGGRLTVQVYAAGDIAPAFGVLEAVADGALHIGHGYPSFWLGQMPAATFLTPIPFGLTTQEQNAWFDYGGGQELADRVYGQMGLKFFPSGNTSVQGAGWFNKELNSMADFRGLSVRIGGLGALVLQAVGATPVQMPLGEVPQALQAGVLDGADYVGPHNDMAFGLHRAAKYYYWPGIFEPCGVLDCFINLSAWEELEDDLKEIVRGANAFTNQVVISEFVARNAEALKTIDEGSDAEVRLFNDDVLKGLAVATKDVLEQTASADPLSREVYDSITKFKETVVPYTNLTEMAFMRAREQFANGG